jgi:hypothetical protein
VDHFERAQKTLVFDHPDGSTIILRHPGGQDLPDPREDPKFYRDNFGILPEHRPFIVPLSESRQRPLTEEEKDAERAKESADNVAFAPGVAAGGMTAAEAADLRARVAKLEELLGAGGEDKAPPAKK